MNHYPFTIRHYYDDAGHLSPIEHYIYRTMMDWYYLDEKPIPDDQRLTLRRLKLKAENKQDLTNVLADFFTLRNGHWHNKRIDAELEIYRSGNKQKSAAGRASALARAKANNTLTVEQPFNDRSTPVIEEVRSKNKEVKKKSGGFTPPSQQDVIAYWTEKNLLGDPEQFFDHFTSNGWKVSGKAPMKDWKAAARNWSKREVKNETSKRSTTGSKHSEVVDRLAAQIAAESE